MKFNRKMTYTGLSFVLLLFIACSEVNEPVSDSRQSDLASSYDVADAQFEFMDKGGVPLSDCQGLFTIGWREFFGQAHQESETGGNAMAVGFSEPITQRPRPFTGGVDMGSVYINYASQQLEMRKMQRPQGGVIYTLFPERMTGTSPLSFIPGISYQFDVTGSEFFPAIQISLTSPAGTAGNHRTFGRADTLPHSGFSADLGGW